MISPTKTAPTIVTNALPGESATFTIKATGKAFRILIDGLYERKEAAVVREIMSNAWDSHMAAGTPDAQIKVTCPTSMDPIFRVRDYGVSMTHEQIMHLYTTIFESTKESTNDQLGQFGLGSKTPFAYTDSFTVTAWLDGEKRSYVAYITDDDVPVINHVSTEPQGDELQGIEISVPVRPADLNTFKTEIAHMVMSSDVLPVLDGMTMPADLFVHEAETWRVVRDHYGMGQFAIRQGCVVYPSHQFRSAHVNYGYTLIVDVPIGSVDVTANREAMSLNDVTRETVYKRLDEVNTEIKAYIDELNASFANRLEAFKANARHEGWLNASIGRSTITLPPDKPNPKVPAQELKCYHTKTKTRPVYHFNAPEKIRLLVDTGEPVVRRAIRIGNFYERNRYNMVAVVDRSQVARLVRLLGLKKEQLIALQDLPDVPTVSTAGMNVGRHAAPKTLPADTYWLPKTGAKSVNMRIGEAWIGTADDLDTHSWLITLNALGIKRDKIVFLTERQAESLNAPEDRRLDTVLVEKAQEYAQKKNLQAKFQAAVDHQLLDQMSNYWTMEQVLTKGFSHRLDPSLRNVLFARYDKIVDTFRPKMSTPSFSEIDQQIRRLLDMSRSGALTADVISAKVVSEMKPFEKVIKSNNPLDLLVEFYINNQ